MNRKPALFITNIPVGKDYEIAIIYGTYTHTWKTDVEIKKNKTTELGTFEITTEEIKENSDIQTYAISY